MNENVYGVLFVLLPGNGETTLRVNFSSFRIQVARIGSNIRIWIHRRAYIRHRVYQIRRIVSCLYEAGQKRKLIHLLVNPNSKFLGR